MEFKKIDQKSYQIHTIKTNRYKTTKIEVVFRLNAEEENVWAYNFLADMLNESAKKYPSRRYIALELEDLYKTYYYTYVSKVGSCLAVVFTISFINPEYIDEKDYLKKVIAFLFEMIMHPDVKNNEFNETSFNIVKNDILLNIESLKENPEKLAINNALKAMDANSSSAKTVIGTKEDIESLTCENLYDYYLRLINKANVDIFAIGNTNLENIVKLIKENYVNRTIRNNKLTYYIENIPRKKLLMVNEKSNFLQSQLVAIYNLINLTKEEKELTFHLLNYILGSGGLNSKLYRYIREENSYCYHISSMYFKYDNLLCIASSLSKENIKDTIRLIKKALKEMQNGDFTEEDINDAKQNLLLSLKINRNKPGQILTSYQFETFLGNYSIEEKIEKITKITKEDIVLLAKKIKENTVYVLSEDEK